MNRAFAPKPQAEHGGLHHGAGEHDLRCGRETLHALQTVTDIVVRLILNSAQETGEP